MVARVQFFELDGKFGIRVTIGERTVLEMPAQYASDFAASCAWGNLRFSMTHSDPEDFDSELVRLVRRGDVVVDGVS